MHHSVTVNPHPPPLTQRTHIIAIRFLSYSFTGDHHLILPPTFILLSPHNLHPFSGRGCFESPSLHQAISPHTIRLFFERYLIQPVPPRITTIINININPSSSLSTSPPLHLHLTHMFVAAHDTHTPAVQKSHHTHMSYPIIAHRIFMRVAAHPSTTEMPLPACKPPHDWYELLHRTFSPLRRECFPIHTIANAENGVVCFFPTNDRCMLKCFERGDQHVQQPFLTLALTKRKTKKQQTHTHKFCYRTGC